MHPSTFSSKRFVLIKQKLNLIPRTSFGFAQRDGRKRKRGFHELPLYIAHVYRNMVFEKSNGCGSVN